VIIRNRRTEELQNAGHAALSLVLRQLPGRGEDQGALPIQGVLELPKFNAVAKIVRGGQALPPVTLRLDLCE